MARMRYIKPGFWTDGVMVRLSPFARLLYIGSWNFAMCELGHLPDDPFELKLQILPADQVDPAELVEELVAADRFDRVTAGGRTYLRARRLPNHQKTDKRYEARCPACTALSSAAAAGAPGDSPPPPEEPPVTPGHAEPPPVSTDLPDSLPFTPEEGKGGKGSRKEQRPPRAVRAVPDEPGPADRFDEFFEVFPRKVGKSDALKAWVKAVKRTKDPQRLIEAAARYAAECRRTGRSAEHIKHPSSWLNSERYDDPVEPAYEPPKPAYWRRPEVNHAG